MRGKEGNIMVVRRRITFVVLCVVLIGWLGLGLVPALSNEAIAPDLTVHYSQILGVQYKLVPDGFRLLEESYFLFDDGYVAARGDTVIRVGMETYEKGKTLDGMITRARMNGDRYMVIVDVNDGQRYAHEF